MTPEQQRLKALERANNIRTYRADLKHDLKVGKVHLRECLTRPPWWLWSIRVEELLRAAPAMGRVKAGTAVKAIGARPSTPLHTLSAKRRRRLIAHLEVRCPGALKERPSESRQAA
jgi:hypothetical protein